ncbi:hypothetical protein [Magnetofaba australis]|nr:hypothetical protein [Magnetofaba australis]
MAETPRILRDMKPKLYMAFIVSATLITFNVFIERIYAGSWDGLPHLFLDYFKWTAIGAIVALGLARWGKNPRLFLPLALTFGWAWFFFLNMEEAFFKPDQVATAAGTPRYYVLNDADRQTVSGIRPYLDAFPQRVDALMAALEPKELQAPPPLRGSDSDALKRYRDVVQDTAARAEQNAKLVRGPWRDEELTLFREQAQQVTGSEAEAKELTERFAIAREPLYDTVGDLLDIRAEMQRQRAQQLGWLIDHFGEYGFLENGAIHIPDPAMQKKIEENDRLVSDLLGRFRVTMARYLLVSKSWAVPARGALGG